MNAEFPRNLLSGCCETIISGDISLAACAKLRQAPNCRPRPATLTWRPLETQEQFFNAIKALKPLLKCKYRLVSRVREKK